jgi:ATP-dependent DNA ligase
LADADALMKYQALCIEAGFEGAMLRHGEASYETGKRSASLLKVKTFREGEFVIQQVVPTNGTFALTSENSNEVQHVKVAKFVLQTVQGYPFEVTAPGNIADKLYALKHPGELVGRTVTIKYQTYTATKEPVPFLPVATGYPDEE